MGMSADLFRYPLFERRWVCVVFTSGYHNGCRCGPGDAHGDWGCGYRWVADALPDTSEAAALVERIEWLRSHVLADAPAAAAEAERHAPGRREP